MASEPPSDIAKESRKFLVFNENLKSDGILQEKGGK